MSSMSDLPEEYVFELLYKNSKVIIDHKAIADLTRLDIEYLNGFHMVGITEVYKQDDYFCGIRANHFCVEFGKNEFLKNSCFLVSANHKGTRMMTMVEFRV